MLTDNVDNVDQIMDQRETARAELPAQNTAALWSWGTRFPSTPSILAYRRAASPGQRQRQPPSPAPPTARIMTALSKVIGVLLLVGSATAPPTSNKEGTLTEEGGAKNAAALGKAEHRGGPMLKPAPYVPPDPLPAQYAPLSARCSLWGRCFFSREGDGRRCCVETSSH